MINKNQIEYIIIGIIAIILIVVGLFYYQKGNKDVLLPENQNNTNVEVPVIDENEVSEPTKTIEPLSASEIKAKFNTTMDNARTAFINKDYSQSITYYKQALSYRNTDTPYSGLFIVYGAQGDWVKAQEALESAIKLNPLFVDYWVSKLTVLDEKTNTSFEDLKKVYNEGLLKVDPAYKINLVTYFAGVAESSGEKAEAIALWEYAKQVYPESKLIYQGEIDRLKE